MIFYRRQADQETWSFKKDAHGQACIAEMVHACAPGILVGAKLDAFERHVAAIEKSRMACAWGEPERSMIFTMAHVSVSRCVQASRPWI